MATGRKITVEFIGTDKTLGSTASKVEQRFGKLGGKLERVGAVAGKLLLGGALAGGAALVKMGQAAADDEAAQVKLATALRQAAGASDEQIASTEKWITAQGKALGVSDDELRPALGRLADATGSVSKAQDLAALAMDVSAGTGKDLNTVIEALVKAQNGSIGGLSRLGVATKDAEGKTKSLKQVTGDLANLYSGRAAAAADTTAGKQKRLQVALGELGEEIGARALPALVKLSEVGLKMVDWVSRNQTSVGVLVAAIGGLTAIVWAASAAMKAYVAITKVWRGVTKAAVAVQWALNVAMRANPIGLVVTALAALAAGLVFAYRKSETFRRIVNGAFGAVKTGALVLKNFVVEKFNALVGFFSGLPSRVSNVTRGMFNGIKEAFRSAINWIIEKWNDLSFGIPGFDPPGPGPSFGGISIGTPNIPHLAAGGVVKARPGGTLAFLGEGGHDEAVVPLSGPHKPRGLGGPQVVFTGPVYGDPRAFARFVVEELRKEKRLRGTVLGIS